MCWVYLLKKKSDSFQTFRNFHKWIENDAQPHIGSIHTDNGKEYTSNEFENYLCQHEIKHQTTTPYNPQQNGVAERMNRTILNMVRSMLFFKNVKIMFWADSVLCAAYIKNRCPSNAIRNKTPYELWYGHVPSVKHLRVFGSTYYALILKVHRNKLGARSHFEPTSFKEASSHDEWKEVMQKEYDALIRNDTWKLVDPPFGTKPIGCKWVYKNKYKADGSLKKHKARLVAKGFAQKEGVDYEETFSPTTKWATIWTLFALATQNGWKVHQMDVKTAFLNGDLKENVFMS
eukprot:PITA_29619